MVTAVVKPVAGVLAANPVDGLVQGRLQGFAGAGRAGAQLGFKLAPGLFDGREVGRVGRQKQQFHAARSQPLARAAQLMHRQVVEYQHVTRT